MLYSYITTLAIWI